MKIIKGFFLGVVFLGLIVSAGIFIFLETFDTDAYLPAITRQASQVLARSVTVAHAALGVSWGRIILDVGPVVIADDANFTSQPFVRVERVHLGLDIVSLIVRREIRITDILIQSPEIHIIRSYEGIFNVRSIAGNFAGERGKPAAVPGFVINPSGVLSTSQPRKAGFAVRSIKIRDASISFIDQTETFPLDIWVSDINGDIDDFSLTHPFRLSFEARSLSQVPNLRVNALVSLNDHLDISISDLTFYINLAGLDANQVKGINPQLAHISLPAHFTGNISLSLAHLEIKASQALTLQAQVKLSDCVIEHFDITKLVLSHTLGTISELFTLPDNFLDGPLNGQCTFSIHDSTLFIDDSSVQTKTFDFMAKGSVDKELNTNVQTMLRLQGDVSLALAGKFKMLEYLLDNDKRIAIPAMVTGVFPHLEYKLDKDFRKKIKKAFKKEGPRQIINDVLSNFLR